MTVVVAAIVAIAVSCGAFIVTVGGHHVAAVRTQTVADLAAIAGATVAMTDRRPGCDAAREVSAVAGFDVESCGIDEAGHARVVVRDPDRGTTAEARAGPAAGPVLGS